MINHPFFSVVSVFLVVKADEIIRDADGFHPRTGRPKELSRLADWKAKDFGFFLFFYVFLLQGIIHPSIFGLFMLLRSGILPLLQPIDVFGLDDSRKKLNEFVRRARDHFGNKFVVFNVHMLTHLAELVWRQGPLWCYSSFPLESWAGILAKSVPQFATKNILQTAVRRSSLYLLISSQCSRRNFPENMKRDILIELGLIRKGYKNDAKRHKCSLVGLTWELCERELFETLQLSNSVVVLSKMILLDGMEVRARENGVRNDCSFVKTRYGCYGKVIRILDIEGAIYCTVRTFQVKRMNFDIVQVVREDDVKCFKRDDILYSCVMIQRENSVLLQPYYLYFII